MSEGPKREKEQKGESSHGSKHSEAHVGCPEASTSTVGLQWVGKEGTPEERRFLQVSRGEREICNW
jgi:hypothetical protein